jgi:hypothetical protein
MLMGHPDRLSVDESLGKEPTHVIACIAQAVQYTTCSVQVSKGWKPSMSKSFWLAFAAYLVPSFPLGYFWHLTTLREQYERLAMYREPVIILLGLASMLVQGLIYAWIFPRLFSTARIDWMSSAALFALIFGLLAWSFTSLPVAAKYRMTSVGSFLALESGFTVLQFVVVAPLIALAWRYRV